MITSPDHPHDITADSLTRSTACPWSRARATRKRMTARGRWHGPEETRVSFVLRAWHESGEQFTEYPMSLSVRSYAGLVASMCIRSARTSTHPMTLLGHLVIVVLLILPGTGE